MDTGIVKASLQGSVFFGGVADSVLDELLALAVPLRLKKDETLLEEGEVATAIYLLVSGRARCFSDDGQGKKFVFMFHEKGDMLGEVSLIDGGPSAWTIKADGDCELLMFRQSDLARVFGCPSGIPNEDVKDRLMVKLVKMVRHFSTAAKHLALLDVYGRIRILFNSLLVEENGCKTLSGPLTQQEIADRIGSSREMVARILKELVYGHYIRLENRRIIILKMLPENF